MANTASNQERKMRVAVERVVGFAQEFGEAHLNLACHAAFPLSLTPDLLYQIWANFVPEAPWTAVARVLLSRLCKEVGSEMYEMDNAVRNLLLRELKAQFGQERFDSLGEFLLEYVSQRLTADDPDTQDLRQAQEWTALAYTKPEQAARELAKVLSEKVQQEDVGEVLRLSSLVETLSDPLVEAGFRLLFIYGQGMRSYFRGDFTSAKQQFDAMQITNNKIKVAGLSLHIPLPLPDDFLEIEREVSCYAQEEKIVVKIRILMMLESIRKYKMADSPNLEKWLKRNIDIVVKSILFKKKYIDILVDFDSIQQDIRNEIIERAKDIGYAINQIISIPDLEPLYLRQNFCIEFQESFETKVSQVKVKLNIVINAKINNLRKIEDLINSHIDIKVTMQDVVKRNIKYFLHTVEPERFYMRFSYPDYYNHPEEKFSLENELIKIIRHTLEEDPFYATVISVVAQPLITDIVKRFNRLAEKICVFEFEVNPLNHVESICFQGNIQVESVDKYGWYIFQSRKYELEDIKDIFVEHITAKLSTLDYQTLRYTSARDLSALEKLLNNWGNALIIEQFGLEVKIFNVSRKRTYQEATTFLEKQAKSALQKLLKRREILLLMDDSIEELEVIDHQIYEIVQDYKNNQEIISILEKARKSALQKLLKRREILLLMDDSIEEIEDIDLKIAKIAQESEHNQEIASILEKARKSALQKLLKRRETLLSMDDAIEEIEDIDLKIANFL